ncbi:MAG: hypothetical protein P8104_05345, partial [Gammaproteobacteria bacterium]
QKPQHDVKNAPTWRVHTSPAGRLPTTDLTESMMANEEFKPGKPLSPTKIFTSQDPDQQIAGMNINELGGKLLRLQDTFTELLAAHVYQQNSLFECIASGRPFHDSQILLGMSLANERLTNDSRMALQEFNHLQDWLRPL